MKRQTIVVILALFAVVSLLAPCVVSAGTSPGIHINSPKGTDSIVAGARVTVSWTWDGDPGPLKFEMVDADGFVKDHFAVSIAKPQNSLLWTVRVQEYNWHVYHKVVARTMNGNKVVGESAHFTIQAPEISVSLSPAGAVWPAGQIRMISWSPKTLAGDAKVELVRKSDNQAVLDITALVPFQQGSCNWAPNKSLPAAYDGKEFVIRVWNKKIGTWGDSAVFKIDL